MGKEKDITGTPEKPFKLIKSEDQIDATSTKKEISYEPMQVLSLQEVQELDKKYLLQNYARIPMHFTYGSGEFLYDEHGKEYIDFLSGIAVTALGHAHADLIGAITHQADLVWHTSNLFYNQQQAMLARAIVELTFPGKVFFCNSGTEANEAAIKLMKAWGVEHSGETEKNKIISLKGGFHGRTYAAMSVTGQEKIHSGFGDLMQPITFVPANDISSLEEAFDDTVCGFILEPIQGEGGVIPLTSEYIEKARELCDTYNAVLVFDEIQTGIGRTGTYFAFQQYTVQPDVVTMAKGLGGGFPMGAMLVADNFTDVLKSGMHGSTFGGNHLACAVAYEVLRTMEAEKILANVIEASDYLNSLLENLKTGYPNIVKEIRGMGLLIGIVLREDIQARPLVQKALEKNLIIGRAGDNVIRLAPPLIVRMSTIERAVAKLEDLIRELE